MLSRPAENPNPNSLLIALQENNGDQATQAKQAFKTLLTTQQEVEVIYPTISKCIPQYKQPLLLMLESLVSELKNENQRQALSRCIALFICAYIFHIQKENNEENQLTKRHLETLLAIRSNWDGLTGLPEHEELIRFLEHEKGIAHGIYSIICNHVVELYSLKPNPTVSWTLTEKGRCLISEFRNRIKDNLESSEVTPEMQSLASQMLGRILQNSNNISRVKIGKNQLDALHHIHEFKKNNFVPSAEIPAHIELIGNILEAYSRKENTRLSAIFSSEKLFQPYFPSYSQLTAEELLAYPNPVELISIHHREDVQKNRIVFRHLLHKADDGAMIAPMLKGNFKDGAFDIFKDELNKSDFLTRNQLNRLVRNFLSAYQQLVQDKKSSDTRKGHSMEDKNKAVTYLIANIEQLDSAFLTNALKDKNYLGLQNGRLNQIVLAIQKTLIANPHLTLKIGTGEHNPLLQALIAKDTRTVKMLFEQLLRAQVSSPITECLGFEKNKYNDSLLFKLFRLEKSAEILSDYTEVFIRAYIDHLKSRLQGNDAEPEKVKRSIRMLEVLLAIKSSWDAPEIALEHDEIAKLISDGVTESAQNLYNFVYNQFVFVYSLGRNPPANRLTFFPHLQKEKTSVDERYSYVLTESARAEIQNFIQVLEKMSSSFSLELKSATLLVIAALTRFEKSKNMRDIGIGQCHVDAWLACRKELEKRMPGISSEPTIASGLKLLDVISTKSKEQSLVLADHFKLLTALTPEEYLACYKEGSEEIRQGLVKNKNLEFRLGIAKLLLLQENSQETMVCLMQDYANFMNVLGALQSVLSEEKLTVAQRKHAISNFLKAYYLWVERYEPINNIFFDKNGVMNALQYLLANINLVVDKEFLQETLQDKYKVALTSGRLEKILNVLQGKSAISVEPLSKQMKKNYNDAPFILEQLLKKKELDGIKEWLAEGDDSRWYCAGVLRDLILHWKKQTPGGSIFGNGDYISVLLACYIEYFDSQKPSLPEDKAEYEYDSAILNHLQQAIEKGKPILSQYSDYEALRKLIGDSPFETTCATTIYMDLASWYFVSPSLLIVEDPKTSPEAISPEPQEPVGGNARVSEGGVFGEKGKVRLPPPQPTQLTVESPEIFPQVVEKGSESKTVTRVNWFSDRRSLPKPGRSEAKMEEIARNVFEL